VFLTFTQAAGSTLTSSISLRLNNTTDTLISNAVLNDASYTYLSNTALSVSVVAGDYVEFKWVTPAWAANPTNIGIIWTLFVE
jgi:hypothetical protein